MYNSSNVGCSCLSLKTLKSNKNLNNSTIENHRSDLHCMLLMHQGR